MQNCWFYDKFEVSPDNKIFLMLFNFCFKHGSSSLGDGSAGSNDGKSLQVSKLILHEIENVIFLFWIFRIQTLYLQNELEGQPSQASTLYRVPSYLYYLLCAFLYLIIFYYVHYCYFSQEYVKIHWHNVKDTILQISSIDLTHYKRSKRRKNSRMGDIDISVYVIWCC